MKRIFLVSVLVSMCAFASMAQHRAIGLRLSNCVEASYQRSVGEANFWEFDGGLWEFGNGAQASALYNWIIASPEWSPKGEWNWYLGVGAGVGMVWGKDYVHGDEELGCFVGVAGMLGLEYKFWFPLAVSADIRPVVGPYFGDGVHFNPHILSGLYWPTLSARYTFNN